MKSPTIVYYRVLFPAYAKWALVVLLFSLLGWIIYLGSDILTPLLLSFFFAILLRPVVQFLNKKMLFPHVLAVFTSVILFLSIIYLVVLFISRQVSDFTTDLPGIKSSFGAHYQELKRWILQTFHVSYSSQENYIRKITQENGSQLVGNTINTFSQTLIHIVLIPVFTFLMLIYRNLFKQFLARVVRRKHHSILIKIILEVKLVIHSYIVGLLLEMAIVATLTAGGLMLLGVRYAILLGTITALLNLVPYLGIFTASILCFVAASINSPELSVCFGAAAITFGIHLLDNNFIVPKIVASKVRVNALVSIVGVLLGNALAGIPGMFLAIPTIAITKVIFDRINGLKAWGYLMGDDTPKQFSWGVSRGLTIKPGKTKEEKIAEENKETSLGKKRE